MAGLFTLISARRQDRTTRLLSAMSTAEERRNALATRTGEFLAASYHAVLSLRDYAIADMDDKAAREKSEVWPTVDGVNRTLAAIEVADAASVVTAARDVDRALVDLSKMAGERTFTRDEWRDARHSRMADLPDELKRAARREAEAITIAAEDVR